MAVALASSCGGSAEGIESSSEPRVVEDSRSPRVRSSDGPEPMECDDPGDRRDAVPSEMAQYCICGGGVAGIWQCYGPPDIGHGPVQCSNKFVNPGTGSGSCAVIVSDCADDHLYSLLCIDMNCQCLVDGDGIGELEPRSSCPEDFDELGALCSWRISD